jgi:hypothetical protein
VEESWRGAVGGGMSVALELRSIAKVGACEICSYCSEREKEHCWPAPLVVVVEVQKLVKKKKKKLNTITKASSSDRAGLSPCTRRRRRLWSMYSSVDDQTYRLLLDTWFLSEFTSSQALQLPAGRCDEFSCNNNLNFSHVVPSSSAFKVLRTTEYLSPVITTASEEKVHPPRGRRIETQFVRREEEEERCNPAGNNADDGLHRVGQDTEQTKESTHKTVFHVRLDLETGDQLGSD